MGVSCGRTCRMLRKHLHLHPYKITSVHELKQRGSIRHVEYCRWFRDVITANAEDIWISHFFTDEAWFIYPFTSSATFGQWLICIRSRIHYYMIIKLVCDVPYHEIRWLAPYSSMRPSTRKALCSGSLPLHWTFKWQNCPWLLPTGHYYCTQLVFPWCYYMMCSGTIILKDIWPPWSPDLTPPDCNLWVVIKVAVFKHSPHILLELKKAIAKFIRNIPLVELSRVLTNEIRCIDACLQAHGGHFQCLL
jgi:hypothetical protein